MSIYNEAIVKRTIQTCVKESKEKPLPPGILDLILGEIYNPRLSGSEEKSEEEKKDGNYKYIPYELRRFVNLIINIKKKYPRLKKFVDVGSGIGDKVALAYLFGDFSTVTGIELNTTTFHVSKYFLGENIYFTFEPIRSPKEIENRAKKVLLNMNAFDYDYSQDDFIYMYVPISKHSVMEKLHIKILQEMPIRGICIDVASDLERVLRRKMKGVRVYKDKNLRRFPHKYVFRVGDKSYRIVGSKDWHGSWE